MIPPMARLALVTLAVLAAGCPAGDGDDDYPIGGGGGGGGTSGPRTDGGIGDGGTDGPAALRGRVCLLTDLRRLTSAMPGDCATTGAGNLQVSLGGGTPVLTAADGTFTAPAREGTNLAWQVTGQNLAPSIVPVSASAPLLLPATGDATYNDLLLSNGVTIEQGEGSIVARILRNGTPVMNAAAQIVGGESLQTRYDGTNPTVWATTATGMLGVAWLPDNVAGVRTLRVVQGTTQLLVPVTIVAQAITFVTIVLP
jgi:hypothetical protein